MPLFFMASGAVARAVPTRILAPRLLLALGLPTLSFAILFLGLDYLIEGVRHVRPIFAECADRRSGRSWPAPSGCVDRFAILLVRALPHPGAARLEQPVSIGSIPWGGG